MAKGQTLNFPKGSTYMIPFQFRSPGNDTGDWTGWRCYFVVKKQLSDPDTAAIVNVTVWPNPSTGYNELILSASETNEYEVGRYYYQATVVDSTGTVGKSEIGAFIVEQTTLEGDVGDFVEEDYGPSVGPPGAGAFTYGANRPIYLDVNIVVSAGMSPQIYDPRHIQKDVYNVDYHTDGVNNKVYTAADKTKLAGIATGATANQTDAYLLNRANHTGSQAIATITGLQAALDAKGDSTALAAHVADHNNPHSVTKAQVGLGNADNTPDTAKNVLSATKLTTPRNINGVPFDGTANITIADATKEPTLEPGTTSQYYRGDKTWQTLNKSAVGLGNVDNTSDADKPVSAAQAAAIAFKEDAANKSTATALGSSDILYPTQKAVKTYVDTKDALKADKATVQASSEQARIDSMLRLPVITINLDGGLDPTTTEIYIPGTYTITDTEKGVVHSGILELRGRGNSTWSASKKPWRIKFDNKTAPLGMTASQKNWALLAMAYDTSQIGNALGLTLGKGMSGLDWTPEYRFVELVLNNTYRGIYQLADLVRIEGNRVAGPVVTGDTGSGVTGTWLMEITNKERPGNSLGIVPDPGFFSSIYNVWIAYDDPELPTAAQDAYMQSYITQFETALAAKDGSWRQYADEESFIDWWLINDLLRNGDSVYWSSCKITKDRDGLLKMGPLWDHDLSTGRYSGTPGDDINTNLYRDGWYTRNAVWIKQMWDNDVPFRALAKTRWQVLLNRLEDMGGIEAWIDRTTSMVSRAARDDRERWPGNYTTYTKYIAQNADFRKRWLRYRIDWITNEFNNTSTNTYTPIYTDEY